MQYLSFPHKVEFYSHNLTAFSQLLLSLMSWHLIIKCIRQADDQAAKPILLIRNFLSVVILLVFVETLFHLAHLRFLLDHLTNYLAKLLIYCNHSEDLVAKF